MVENDEDEDVRAAGVISLASLAQEGPPDRLYLECDHIFISLSDNAHVRDSIKSALPKTLDLAWKDSHRQVRLAWIEVLTVLARNGTSMRCLLLGFNP
jgi:hypothetical protein